MFESKVEMWPGGITTMAGGTRTAIKLDRPWQKDIELTPADRCPFCLRKPRVVRQLEIGGEGWLVFANDFTPFAFHQLVTPDRCWPISELRQLGGLNRLTTVFSIISQVLTERPPEAWSIMTTHVGNYAGQNVTHAHFHLHDYADTGGLSAIKSLSFLLERSDLVVRKTRTLSAVVGGHRAGQCFIIPELPRPTMSRDLCAKLAAMLHDLALLYAVKFCSQQGLPPDYMAAVLFRGESLCHAMYLPILNHWGATDYHGLLTGGPVILPWPHAVTAAYLRGEIGANP